jgi:hypothetical protein
VPRLELLEARDLPSGSFGGHALPGATPAPEHASWGGIATPGAPCGAAPYAGREAHPAGSPVGRDTDAHGPGPGEWAPSQAQSTGPQWHQGERTADGNPAGAANRPAEGAEQPAPAQPTATSAVRVSTSISLPPSAATSAQVPLPVAAEQAPSQETATQSLAPLLVVVLSTPPLNALASGAAGARPSAPVVFGPTVSDHVPADLPHHLAPEAGPDSAGGLVEPPGPPALPALAGLLTPAAAGVGPGPFRFLRRLFPAASAGGFNLGAGWRWLLCATGLAAVAGLEVLRRRTRRRAPSVRELPEITGPAGL